MSLLAAASMRISSKVTVKGPYTQLASAYPAAISFIAQNGLQPGGCYDLYLNNPKNTPEKDLLKEICFPVF